MSARWLALAAIALVACEREQPVPAAIEPPTFDDPLLIAGRAVWLDACQRCHLEGRAGAPRIGDRAAWKPRIAKGMELLVQHALGGFEGPGGGMMPPRGGAKDLSDQQIASAVAYVVAASKEGDGE